MKKQELSLYVQTKVKIKSFISINKQYKPNMKLKV